MTEPLFRWLLRDGGPQRVWHPAKCLRLAATLEAVIMARRRLATRPPPLHRHHIFKPTGCGDRTIISPAGQRLLSGGYFWSVAALRSAVWPHFVLCTAFFFFFKYITAQGLLRCCKLPLPCNRSFIVHHPTSGTVTVEFVTFKTLSS